MIRLEAFEQTEGKGKVETEIKGEGLKVRAELSMIINTIAKKHPELIGSIFLGLATADLDEDDVLDDVHSAFRSVEIANTLKNFGNILDAIKLDTKKVDKNAEKCKNCNDKGMKKDIKSLLKEIFEEGEGDE